MAILRLRRPGVLDGSVAADGPARRAGATAELDDVRDRRAMANTFAHGRQGAAVRADRPSRRHSRGQPLRRQGPGGGGQRARHQPQAQF